MHMVSQRTDPQTDPRVAAVMAVLRGGRTGEVARQLGVEPVLLGRWVRGFVDAGTATVTNEPGEREAHQRDRFLAAFAHELRTPLAVARGWYAVLDDDELTGEEADDARNRLGEGLERLNERVLDVELLASASLGRLRVEPQRVTVGEVLAGHPSSIEPDQARIPLTCDLFLLRRTARDMWAASGLQPAPRERRWEARTDGAWVELRLVREAEPIDTQLLQALYDPFETNDDDTGITIGLYLARALVVAHGGTLGLEQDDDRAVFWIRIPARSDRPLTATPTHQEER
ncbi:MAG: HAMP domain-containing histidine kinase [Marmoricola sp.]|nr:HAMP domain-containing histidine kinase [Marmoricola sp.]